MTQKRGAPQGGAPGRRHPGRDRRRRDVYTYVEGGTEHDYLSYLNSRFGGKFSFYLHINVDRAKGMTPTRLLDAAEVKAHELVDEQPRSGRVRGDSQLGPYNTNLPIWIFFDRDDNTQDELIRVHNQAARCRVNVVFSHPCFELWLYLHLANSPGPQGGQRARLLDQLRRMHAAYLDYATSGGNKRLGPERLAALAGQEHPAARRARDLVMQCNTGRCDHRSSKCHPVHRDPSTGVYLLLEALEIVPP